MDGWMDGWMYRVGDAIVWFKSYPEGRPQFTQLVFFDAVWVDVFGLLGTGKEETEEDKYI